MKRTGLWVLVVAFAFTLFGCAAQVSEQQAKDYGMTPEEKAAGQKAGDTADSER